jgi:hypothetical protein
MYYSGTAKMSVEVLEPKYCNEKFLEENKLYCTVVLYFISLK